MGQKDKISSYSVLSSHAVEVEVDEGAYYDGCDRFGAQSNPKNVKLCCLKGVFGFENDATRSTGNRNSRALK